MHKSTALPAALNSLLGALLFITSLYAQTSPPATYPNFPSETPAKLVPATDGFDHDRRDVMIPMRDGVKLHTVILPTEGCEGRADPADAHAIQRYRTYQPRPQRPPRFESLRLRQRY
jgi:predicted acyl esterase